MERTTLQVGSFEVNCSILAQAKKALIVDPGQEAKRILKALAKLELSPAAILLTHGHFDHIGGVSEILAEYPKLKVYLGKEDMKFIGEKRNQLPPDYPLTAFGNLIAAELAEELPFGIKVIATPGHTPGGVCYYLAREGLLLAGDTLFAGSVGRTDLPGGNMATLMNSLEKLKGLPKETQVVPGHGPFTTIADELKGNPFLQ